MRAKKTINIIIDILMYAIMLIQMMYAFTGNTAHEVLGIAFFLCLILHIVFKRAYITGMLRSMMHRNKEEGTGIKISSSRRFFNIVTFLLFLLIIILMVSSMGVSRMIFTWFPYFGSADLHRYLATAVLTLSVVHGGMHPLIKSKKHKKLIGILIAIGAAASIAIGTALVPYLDRHFKKVSIDHISAIKGEKLKLSINKPLVVYFTRNGNTDFEDDVDTVSGASLMLADGKLYGNTELLADMVEDAIDCDVIAITLTGEKYPSSYGDTVSVAGKELRENKRPEINSIDIKDYNDVILIYPIWWGTVPMPVATFLEQNKWDGKNLWLLATQGSSGFVSSTKDIKKMADGAKVNELISVYCDDVVIAREQVGSCLKESLSDYNR